MKDFFKNDFSKAEKIFLGIIAFVILLSSTLLYADFRRRIKVEGKKPIGVLKLKYKTTQRKYAHEVVWEELDNNYPIYNEDAIRTGREAKAYIELQDGTKIEIGENSMIVLNLAGQSADIGFLYGALKASQREGGQLKISTTTSEVKLSQGGDISLSANEKEISLSVEKGAAILTTEGKAISIEENKQATVQEKEVNVEEIPIKLISPSSTAQIFTDSKAQVLFEWEAKGSVEFEIAQDQQFRRIWKSQKAIDQVREKIPPGVYYWRVRQKTPKPFISEVRPLMVLEAKKLIAISPPPNAVIESSEESTLINFQFSRYEYANSYLLKISQNPDLSSPIIDEEILTPFVARRLTPGTYYWQVKAKLPPDAPKVETPIQKFTILRKTQVEPPLLQFPPDGYRVNKLLIPTKGILFSWNEDKNYESYLLEIGFDKNFSSKEQMILKENSFLWKKELPKGTFFWKITGKTNKGEEKSSSVYQFIVEEKAPFRLIQPERDARFQEKSTLEFIWASDFESGEVFLIIARDSQFHNTFLRQRTTENRFIVYNLESGTYFWKVFTITPQGMLESEVRAFEISSSEIKLIEPKPNSIIDMSDKASLRFIWEGKKDLGYKLSLFFVEKDKNVKIFSSMVMGTEFEFKDLRKLNEGRYIWVVETDSSSKSEQATFVIELQKKPQPPEIEVPEFFYIE